MVELGAQSVIYELSSAAYMVRAGCIKPRSAWEEPPDNGPADQGWGGKQGWEVEVGNRQVMTLRPAVQLHMQGFAADGKSLYCSNANLPQITCCGRRKLLHILLPLTSSLSPATQVPLGFSVAASVRVGNALGSGDVVQAKTSCITALLCTGEPRSCRGE